ncbi:hypothetical protein G6F70_000908 [Rhizopus microsporus]|nr:hypothetical protein G6F71_000672 [Rhizopus microsporus]KAG1203911.1 hypothetical protein G6F70_000908 [Rhizopus microsporus]KAG1208897.1 hypothetical protein G6F69_006815 [Rhizopus microsporus]KAG1232533.1 hypothetical protein G6F67_004952 [Rhizopus microsporus]KAG1262011.1 hypothetical protein G6F68_006262 [Rhizopus microsporus]
MGSFFSKEKTDSKDYEKILSELDNKIQKAESRLSEIKIRQRRTSFMWIIYSLIIWVFCLVYLFRQVNDPFNSAEDYLIPSLPVVLLPLGIYYIRRGLIYFYDMKQKKEEANLSVLRKEQKEKIEELKKKTSYYTTQSLIERYDEVSKKKKDEAAKESGQDLRQRKPVSMPVNRPIPPLQQQQQQQQQQPYPRAPIPQQAIQNYSNQQKLTQPNILQQPRVEPRWYDKLVDALVGDAGPETKYALICNHCFAHNGLVLQEEYDTIQYVCPVCKQFNPSRKSKQVIPKNILEENNTDEKEHKPSEKEIEDVIKQLKKEVEEDEKKGLNTIASRVRHRRSANSDAEDTDNEDK